jgi:hypothetical protein
MDVKFSEHTESNSRQYSNVQDAVSRAFHDALSQCRLLIVG